MVKGFYYVLVILLLLFLFFEKRRNFFCINIGKVRDILSGLMKKNGKRYIFLEKKRLFLFCLGKMIFICLVLWVFKLEIVWEVWGVGNYFEWELVIFFLGFRFFMCEVSWLD